MEFRVDDMRKTMQDKEYNYYVVAERLSVYEEVEERFISCYSYNQNATLNEKVTNKVMAKLSADKYGLQKEI